MHKQFSAQPPLSEHSFPHLCKGHFHVSPSKIDTNQGAVILWLHRNSCLSAWTIAGSCSNYSKLTIKTLSRIIRALPAPQHYHPSSCTKELLPDTRTKAVLSLESHKTITSVIKSNLLFFSPDNYLLRKQEGKLIVPNIFCSLSVYL